MMKSKNTNRKKASVIGTRVGFGRTAIAMAVAAFTGQVTAATDGDPDTVASGAAYEDTTMLNSTYSINVVNSTSSVQFTQGDAEDTLFINAGTGQKAILNWSNFNIHASDTIDFGNSGSIYLNKTSDGNASTIAGNIGGHSGATVIFLNTNGITVSGEVASLKNFMVSTVAGDLSTSSASGLSTDLTTYNVIPAGTSTVTLGNAKAYAFGGRLRVVSGGAVTFTGNIGAATGVQISSNDGALVANTNLISTTAGVLQLALGTGTAGIDANDLNTAAGTIDLLKSGEVNIDNGALNTILIGTGWDAGGAVKIKAGQITVGDGSATRTNLGTAGVHANTSVGTLALDDSGSVYIDNTGAIALADAATTLSGSVISITGAANDGITINSFDGTTARGSSLILDSNAGTTTFTNDKAVKVLHLTVAADTLALGTTINKITATGAVILKPDSGSTAINLGNNDTAFAISNAELKSIAVGGSGVTIGSSAAGAITVVGTTVNSFNHLTLKGASLVFSDDTGIVLTGKNFAATVSGNITSAANDNVDITAANVTLVAAGNVGASDDTTDIDLTATGLVSVQAGNAAANAVDVIYLRSMGATSLGLLEVKNSGAALNAADKVRLLSVGDVTDGGVAADANIKAAVVKIGLHTTDDDANAAALGVSGNLIEIEGVGGAAGLDITKLDGTASTTSASFKGIHIDTNASITLQKDLFISNNAASTGITIKTDEVFTQASGIDLDETTQSAGIFLQAADFNLDYQNADGIVTAGIVTLKDTSGKLSFHTAGSNNSVANDLTKLELAAIKNTITGLTIIAAAGIDVIANGVYDIADGGEANLIMTSITEDINILVDGNDDGLKAKSINIEATAGEITQSVSSAVVLETSAGNLTLKAATKIADDTEVDVVVAGGFLTISALGVGDVDINANASALALGDIDLGVGDTAIIKTKGDVTTGADISSAGTLSLIGDNIIISNALSAKVLTLLSSSDLSTADGKLVVNNAKTLTTTGSMTLKAISILDENNNDILVTVGGTLAVDAGNATGNVIITSTAALALGDIDLKGADTATITTAGELTTGDTIASTGTLVLTGNEVNVTHNVTAHTLTINSSTDGSTFDGTLVVHNDNTLKTTSGNLTLQAKSIKDNANADVLVVVVGDLVVDADQARGDVLITSTSDALELGAIEIGTDDTITITSTEAITTGVATDTVGTLLLTGNSVILNHDVTFDAITIDSSTNGSTVGNTTFVVHNDRTIKATDGNLVLRARSIKDNDNGDVKFIVGGSGKLTVDADGATGVTLLTSISAVELGTINSESGTGGLVTIVANPGITTGDNFTSTGGLVLKGQLNITENIIAESLNLDSTNNGTSGNAALVVLNGKILRTTGGDLTLHGASVLDNLGGDVQVRVGSGNLVIDGDVVSGESSFLIHAAEALSVGVVAVEAADIVDIRTLAGLTIAADTTAGGRMTLRGELGVDFDRKVSAQTLVVKAGAGTTYNQVITGDSIANAILTTVGNLTLHAKDIGDDDDATGLAVVVGSGGDLIIDADEFAGNVEIQSGSALELGYIKIKSGDTATIKVDAKSMTTGAAISTSGTLSLLADGITITQNITADALTIHSSEDNGATPATTTITVGNANLLTTLNGAMTISGASFLDASGNAVDVIVDGGSLAIASGVSGDVKVTSVEDIQLGALTGADSDAFEIATTGSVKNITLATNISTNDIDLVLTATGNIEGTANRNIAVGTLDINATGTFDLDISNNGGGDIVTDAGLVSIEAASVDVGDITTTAAAAGNVISGAVIITSNGAANGSFIQGAIDVINITTTGKVGATSNGGSGGAITILGNSAAVGILVSTGGQSHGANNDAGHAGNISVKTNLGALTLNGAITATGGAGASGNAAGGNAGTITLMQEVSGSRDESALTIGAAITSARGAKSGSKAIGAAGAINVTALSVTVSDVIKSASVSITADKVYSAGDVFDITDTLTGTILGADANNVGSYDSGDGHIIADLTTLTALKIGSLADNAVDLLLDLDDTLADGANSSKLVLNMGQITNASEVQINEIKTSTTLEYNALGTARANMTSDTLDINFTRKVGASYTPTVSIDDTLTLKTEDFGGGGLTDLSAAALAGRLDVLENFLDYQNFSSTNTVAKYLSYIINGTAIGDANDGGITFDFLDLTAVSTSANLNSWTAGEFLTGKYANGVSTGGLMSLAGTGKRVDALATFNDSSGSDWIYTVAGDVIIANNSVVGASIVDGAIANADINAAAGIVAAKITLADGKMLVGSTGNVGAAVTMSGDITMTNTGATSIGNDKVVADDIATDAVVSDSIADGTIAAADIASGAVTSAKILDGTIANADIASAAGIAASKITLADGKMLVGSTGNVGAAVTMSGDITMTNTGATSIGNDKVVADDIATDAVVSDSIADGTIVTADLADDAVTAAKLASNAVVSASIADGSIITADIANGSVTLSSLDSVASSTLTRVEAKVDSLALFKTSSGAAISASGTGTDIAATVLKAIDASNAKANTAALGDVATRVDVVEANGGNTILSFIKRLFGGS